MENNNQLESIELRNYYRWFIAKFNKKISRKKQESQLELEFMNGVELEETKFPIFVRVKITKKKLIETDMYIEIFLSWFKYSWRLETIAVNF